MIEGANIKMATAFAHAWNLQQQYRTLISIKNSLLTLGFDNSVTGIPVTLGAVVVLLTP